jgi:hypothetical protein
LQRREPCITRATARRGPRISKDKLLFWKNEAKKRRAIAAARKLNTGRAGTIRREKKLVLFLKKQHLNLALNRRSLAGLRFHLHEKNGLIVHPEPGRAGFAGRATAR